MRVPVSWLREYVDVDAAAAEIGARLGISSCELVAIHRSGPEAADGNLDRFRVGRVVDSGKHPNADRLQLCEVDVGEGSPRQIVCGARNFGAGALVAVALPGAALTPELTIEQRRVRGVVSDGMLLSERELGIGVDHSGIIVLDDGQPGAPLAAVLPLTDEVLELEMTGNRPDMLSVYGVAREVAALFRAPLAPPPGADPPPAGDQRVEIDVRDPEGCPRYIGRRFDEVRVGPSPLWLRARLTAAGMRPISNVVDVTNYVMLALGNPLHAFDFDTLAGGRIAVRRADAGESIRTLDGSDRELAADDIVIADAERAVAIAGIMGGEETEVTDGTRRVLLEAANFEPVSILRSSQRLHLRTEGSNRWEKGVDPHLAGQAAELATELLVGLAGARWRGHGEAAAELPAPPRIRLRPQRADALIGTAVAPERQREILELLGFSFEGDWVVQPPTWRARDVRREVDLIEEIARVELERVPFRLPARREMFGRLTPEQRLIRRLQDVLVGCGLQEVYTPSLAPSDPDQDALRLPEPASGDQSTLRTTLIVGLVAAARHNVDAGDDRAELFEVARVYLPRGADEPASSDRLPEERYRVGAILAGGFFHAKGVVEAVHRSLRIHARFERFEHELLHPGKTARVEAGWVGELHPRVLPGTWSAFELDVARLLELAPGVAAYRDVITYPAVKEDLAFSVPVDVPAADLIDAARAAAGDELREMRVFDVYSGDQVGPGRRSLAFAVEYQSPDRTLTEDDAARLRGLIVDELARRFGARLRA